MIVIEVDEERLEEIVNAQKIILSTLKEKFPDNKGDDFICITITLQLALGMKLKDFNLSDLGAELYLKEFTHNAKIFAQNAETNFYHE